MNVYFNTFTALGNRSTIDIKLKCGNRILMNKHFCASSELNYDLFGKDELETFFNECSLAIHELGFQKLSAWWDSEIKGFEDEYSATWEHDALLFLKKLQFSIFTVNPIE